MTLGQLLLIHLMAGVGVAGAVYVSARQRSGPMRCFQALSAIFFWPLYLPILLSQKTSTQPEQRSVTMQPPLDELADIIAQVDGELENALKSLDGWSEDVLAREKDRLHELRTAWISQAERIREMDALLKRPEYTTAAPALCINVNNVLEDRLRGSNLAIQQNVDRLRQVRERTLGDLLGTLAWVRELVSMIHLAKFTGAPASRAEELVGQIAAAVEGLSALTWQAESA
ncbi:MAG: hypothetical protein HY040_22310 [Planctomycetes bacterium]|nr:hypothetical protein [Planctomycetota bacterium]